jgi:hypothetical protein
MILCFCLTVSAQEQNNGRVDLSLGFSSVLARPSTAKRTNFSLNGGSMAGAWNFRSGSWAVVGDLGVYHVGKIGTNSVNANLGTFLGGARLTLHRTERTKLFAQALVGLADSNTVWFPQTGVTAKSALAYSGGVGMDYYFRRGFGFRGQADYLATRFQEKLGVASTQNNIRITAALVLRF